MTIEEVKAHQGEFGRLKPVSRGGTKPYSCRVCNKDIEKGEPHYTQSDYTGGGFFPVQTRVCSKCAQTLINNGTEIKKIAKKEKKVKLGCGKDTIYPKPGNSGLWKCGEDAPIIGTILCEDCKNAKDGN